MFGFSKIFIILILIAIGIGYGTQSWENFLLSLAFIVGGRIVWKLLT